MAGLGYYLFANGGGYCVGLRFTDTCLLGGTTFGAIVGLLGLLILWGGVEAYRQGEPYV